MAVGGAGFLSSSTSFLPLRRRTIWRTVPGTFRPQQRVSSVAAGQSAPLTEQTNVGSKNGMFEKEPIAKRYDDSVAESEAECLSLKDYFERSKEMMATNDAGPPRWFSPLECGSRLKDSPLLLFLPGLDGVGLGLILHHQRLGQIFDIWCLHIPIMDRTPFTELVQLVERTVRSENHRSPNRPIYLVGESLGGCLALAVAARNPDIDLMLILSNSATCFNKSRLRLLIPFLEIMPDQLEISVPYMLTGIPLTMVRATVEKGLPLQQTFAELSQGVNALSSFLSVLAAGLPGDALLWKLRMFRSAAAYTNSRLHAVKARTLILSSGKDQLLPSREEGERLGHILPKCEIRKFNDSGHALFLDGHVNMQQEDGVDLVTIIKGASFYRRQRFIDYASDYFPPSPSEIKKTFAPWRWLEMAAAPTMLSTLENGKIVRGLAGIPAEGPVLFVGYHMLLGLEVVPLISTFWTERNLLVRGIAHPMLYSNLGDESVLDISSFDLVRIMGAVPASASNFYKLLSSKSHVLLYPGGAREALHGKGEEYKLFWPEQTEFIRMAARFGAKILPFGVVGEDDIGQVFLDKDDLMKIPYYKDYIEEMKGKVIQLRTDIGGEVSKQDPVLPLILPKIPGRFYYLFGKPIETEGRKQDLRNRDTAHKLYLEVKSEVERCIAYLKDKRENDPYRNIFPRLIYQATHGFDCEVPTFEF